MAIPTADAVPAAPPAPTPTRPRVLFIGTSLAVGACVMAFAGLLGIYLSARAATPSTGDPWPPAGASTPIPPAKMAMLTLVLSSITIQWVVEAVGHNDRPQSFLTLGITVLFGAA